MKYIITIIQIIFWLICDSFLYLYFLKWNLYRYKPTWNGFYKDKYGVTVRAHNGEKYKVTSKNKYKAAMNYDKRK